VTVTTLFQLSYAPKNSTLDQTDRTDAVLGPGTAQESAYEGRRDLCEQDPIPAIDIMSWCHPEAAKVYMLFVVWMHEHAHASTKHTPHANTDPHNTRAPTQQIHTRTTTDKRTHTSAHQRVANGKNGDESERMMEEVNDGKNQRAQRTNSFQRNDKMRGWKMYELKN
jgi:hypothetical protein